MLVKNLQTIQRLETTFYVYVCTDDADNIKHRVIPWEVDYQLTIFAGHIKVNEPNN